MGEQPGRIAGPHTPHVPLGLADVAALVPGRAPPPPPTLAYRLSLSAVAVAGVVLALVYFALVTAAVGGLVWHVSANTGRIGWARGEGHMGVRLYVGLLVLLATVILILVRPLVAGKRPPAPQIAVPRDREPVLHAFVERVAAAVGAPVPAAIEMDDEVNASARLRRGFLSFGGSDLTLTLGAPLVLGMSVEQLASVVAHELGHFRQGAGMRLTYVARTLEIWFARAAFERDRWDERFEQVGRVFGIVQAASWVVRKLFHGMLLGLRAVEALASRRMEWDADEHSLALVGGPVTASALRELVPLDAARERAFTTVNEEYRRGRLPDDVPAIVATWRARLDEASVRTLVESAFEERTTAAASHPCVRERVARAESVAAGPLRCARPARDLLRDPDSLAREVTSRRYAVALGDDASRCTSVATAEALGVEDARTEAHAAFRRWTQGTVAYLVLPPVQDWLASVAPPPEKAVEAARAARDALLAAAPAAREAIRAFDAADTQVVEAKRVEAVLGIEGKPAKMPEITTITDRTYMGVNAAIAGALAAQGTARMVIADAHDALRRRFAASRALLASSGGDAELTSLAAALATADAVAAHVASIRVATPACGDLFREQAELGNKRGDAGLHRFASAVRADLAAASAAASGGPAGLAEALGAPPPADADAAAVAECARAAIEGFYRWWFDAAATLAKRLEDAERAAGLDPLPAAAP